MRHLMRWYYELLPMKREVEMTEPTKQDIREILEEIRKRLDEQGKDIRELKAKMGRQVSAPSGRDMRVRYGMGEI